MKKPSRPKTLVGILLLVGSMLVSAWPGFAGTKEWIGQDQNDPYWMSNENWWGIIGAGPNDDLEFGRTVYLTPFLPVAISRISSTNNFPVNTSFNSLRFSTFDSNQFTGDSFFVSGNQIFLQNGIQNIGTRTTFGPNIILGARQTWTGTGGTMTMNGVVNLNNRSLTINGDSDYIFNSLINGPAGQILKGGNGKVVINGNAQSHGVQLSGGELIVNGRVNTVLPKGGTLAGRGLVGIILAGNPGTFGTISPGDGEGAAGRLTCVSATANPGNNALNPNINLEIDLNGPNAVSQHDQLQVIDNNISLNGANLRLRLGFTPTPGQQFTILSISGTGSIFGQFDQGPSILENNQLFAITYTQNSVVLTSLGQAVP